MNEITSTNFASSIVPKTWSDASAYCKENHATTLAVMDTSQKITEAKELCKNYGVLANEGAWKWENGTSLGNIND